MCGGFFGCVFFATGFVVRVIHVEDYFSKGHLANFYIWRWLTAKTTTDPVRAAASLTSMTRWWTEGSYHKMWAGTHARKHCCRHTTGRISPRALFELATVQRSDPVPLLVHLWCQENRGGTSDWLGVSWHHRGLISKDTCSCAHFVQNYMSRKCKMRL